MKVAGPSPLRGVGFNSPIRILASGAALARSAGIAASTSRRYMRGA
jgi:hypothetical protein